MLQLLFRWARLERRDAKLHTFGQGCGRTPSFKIFWGHSTLKTAKIENKIVLFLFVHWLFLVILMYHLLRKCR